MRRVARIRVLAAFLWFALGAAPAQAQDSTRAADVTARSDVSCFDLAERKLYPNHKMIVVPRNGAEVSGHFLGFPSREESQITPDLPKGVQTIPLTFALADVSELRIQKYRPLRPLYPIAGLLGGTLIGGVIGGAAFTIADGGRDDSFILTPGAVGALIGGAIGGLVGLATGTVLVFHDPGMVSFPCEATTGGESPRSPPPPTPEEPRPH